MRVLAPVEVALGAATGFDDVASTRAQYAVQLAAGLQRPQAARARAPDDLAVESTHQRRTHPLEVLSGQVRRQQAYAAGNVESDAAR